MDAFSTRYITSWIHAETCEQIIFYLSNTTLPPDHHNIDHESTSPPPSSWHPTTPSRLLVVYCKCIDMVCLLLAPILCFDVDIDLLAYYLLFITIIQQSLRTLKYPCWRPSTSFIRVRFDLLEQVRYFSPDLTTDDYGFERKLMGPQILHRRHSDSKRSPGRFELRRWP